MRRRRFDPRLASSGTAHAPSPDVRCGHPVLRSLDASALRHPGCARRRTRRVRRDWRVPVPRAALHVAHASRRANPGVRASRPSSTESASMRNGLSPGTHDRIRTLESVRHEGRGGDGCTSASGRTGAEASMRTLESLRHARTGTGSVCVPRRGSATSRCRKRCPSLSRPLSRGPPGSSAVRSRELCLVGCGRSPG